MFLDTNSIQIKVGNGNYISMGQYIVEAKYGYNKLWSSDSGRNLAGTQSGTLIGIFPKITLQFRKLTKSELEIIIPLLDAPTQSVKYYDPNKKATVTIKNEGFSCSFIATRKRA